jgi:thioredoxin-like negative regulator of GroEL
MDDEEAREQFAKGVAAVNNGHFFLARTCLEHAAEKLPTLETSSYIAYCRSAAHNEHDPTITTVRENLAREPDNPVHHLLLSRILVLANQRQEALDILRQGVHLDTTGELGKELERLGARKPPVFPALARSNPLNRIAGLILDRLELR